jgi:hypothetical protein
MKFVWLFDRDRRVYNKDEKGRSTGGPIWREHWVKHEIVGETSRSWLTKRGQKVPKKGGPGIAFDEAGINRRAFVRDNSYKISQAIARCDDYDTLVKIAEIIGYKPRTEE